MGGRPSAVVKKDSGLKRALTNWSGLGGKKVVPFDEENEIIPDENKAFVEFKMIKVAVFESAGTVTCAVVREGAMEHAVTVDYVTEEGTAKEASDYDRVEGTLKFEKGVSEQTITVKIIDDVAFEEDEEFYIKLSNPQVIVDTETPQAANDSGNAEKKTVECLLGSTKKTTVVIIDDDLPGVLAFEKDSITIPEPKQDEEIAIEVMRKNGSAESIGCSYATENGTAVAGVDYEETSGKLTFAEGEMAKTINVKVKAKGRYKAEMFRIILTEPVAPGKFDEKADGAPDMCILTVIVETDKESKQQVDRMMSSLQAGWEKSKVGNANWADQFKNAFDVMGGEGGDDDGEEEAPKASVGDWIMHIFTLPWKLCFALIPPTDYCGGWACFCGSLIMIGGLTTLIGDLAALFGCVAGIPDDVSAITIVALGTSLPDTFVSMSLAGEGKYADDSVGNVTGSNSVNVFLGLGLPWMIAALYWTVNGQTDDWKDMYAEDQDTAWYKSELCQNGCFVVKAGSLTFSVTVYTICAFTAIVILYARRKFCGGELGGPKMAAWVTAIGLVFLWVIYVALSIWKSTS